MSFDTELRTDDPARGPTNRTGFVVDRIPTQSGVVAAVIALLSVVGISVRAGYLGPVVFGLGSGVVLAIALALLSMDHVLRAGIGGFLLLASVAVALGGPVWVSLTEGVLAGLFAVGGVLVGYGITLFRVRGYGDGAIARAMAWTARVALVVAVTALVVLPFVADVSRILVLVGSVLPVEQLVSPTATGTAFAGFVSLSWFAFAGIWVASLAFPLQAILEGDQLERIIKIRSRVLRVGGVVFGGGSIVIALVYAASVESGSLGGFGEVVTMVVESHVLRLVLLRLVFAGVGIALGIVVVRQVSGAVVGSRLSWVPSAIVVAAGLVLGGHFAGAMLVTEITSMTGEGTVVSSIAGILGPVGMAVVMGFSGLLGVLLVLAVLPLLDSVGMLDEWTAGPRLVLLGVVGAAVLVILDVGATPLAFAGVVGGIVSWDIADHGTALRRDIGTAPTYQWGGLVHAASSVLVGTVTLFTAVILYWIYFSAGIPLTGSVVTALVATLAIALLVFVFRA